MKGKLTTSVNTSVRVRQKITIIKYTVAGTLLLTLIGAGVFVYLNLANSGNAKAGNDKGIAQTAATENLLVDLSHLSFDEMDLLTNHDFERDTVQKEYTSVKWTSSDSLNYLILEVNNSQKEYSLELFNSGGGNRVLYFAELTANKVFVEKTELIPGQQYNYLVKTSIGEMFAGNMKF